MKEAYLEPCQMSMMDLFPSTAESSKWLHKSPSLRHFAWSLARLCMRELLELIENFVMLTLLSVRFTKYMLDLFHLSHPHL